MPTFLYFVLSQRQITQRDGIVERQQPPRRRRPRQTGANSRHVARQLPQVAAPVHAANTSATGRHSAIRQNSTSASRAVRILAAGAASPGGGIPLRVRRLCTAGQHPPVLSIPLVEILECHPHRYFRKKWRRQRLGGRLNRRGQRRVSMVQY